MKRIVILGVGIFIEEIEMDPQGTRISQPMF